MTYEQALTAAKQVGAKRARGLPHLAIVVWTLAQIHAIAPSLIYEGARRRSLTAGQVRKLDASTLGDLMFVEEVVAGAEDK